MLATTTATTLPTIDALDTQAYLCDLDNLGVLEVTGQNAKTFLQGQLTCDLHAMPAERSCLAAFCNAKGRIIASLRIWQSDASYLLILPRNNLTHTLQQLQKYAVFSRVTLSDRSAEQAVFGWLGNAPPPLPLSLPNALNQVVSESATQHCIQISTLPQRYLFIANLDTAKRLWRDLYTPQRHVPVALWELCDIRMKLAHVDHRSSELFTPHDLDYPQQGAVSFSKGCYVGQEIIARMQHLGKLKKHLSVCQGTMQQLPQPGTALINPQRLTVGHIVNAAIDATGNCLALAVVDDSAIGETLHTSDHQTTLRCI